MSDFAYSDSDIDEVFAGRVPAGQEDLARVADFVAYVRLRRDLQPPPPMEDRVVRPPADVVPLRQVADR